MTAGRPSGFKCTIESRRKQSASAMHTNAEVKKSRALLRAMGFKD